MISKERLEELIKQGATIYEVSPKKVYDVILINNDDNICRANTEYLYIEWREWNKYNPLGWWRNSKIQLTSLYETKEEAEFIIKFHTHKTLYFRPPTFEEFLKTRQEGIYCNWYCGDIQIVMEEDNQQKGILKSENIFRVDDGNNYCSFRYEYNEYLDNRKEIYYEALEYVKKLFLGEENHDDQN